MITSLRTGISINKVVFQSPILNENLLTFLVLASLQVYLYWSCDYCPCLLQLQVC